VISESNLLDPWSGDFGKEAVIGLVVPPFAMLVIYLDLDAGR
jgi:hypothetical protein